MGRQVKMRERSPNRVCHEYGETCGFKVMGLVGMGMVSDLAYLCITMYPCHSIMGMYKYITR